MNAPAANAEVIATLHASLKRTAFLLRSACLVITDPEARRIALEAVKQAEAALALTEARNGR